MDPSAAELKTSNSINDFVQWLEIPTDIATALLESLTATDIATDIPAARFSSVVSKLKVTRDGIEKELTPAEEGQAGEVARIALLALTKGPSAQRAAEPEKQAGSGGPQLPLNTSRVKLASVLDQGDDTEIRPLGVEDIQTLILTWKMRHSDGEDPAEDEEATGDQLSALSFRFRAGATPFVDFGVWRPHGAALGRVLKFTGYVQGPGGEFKNEELSGPATQAEWARSWRVFAFAMEVLGAVSRAVYPELWWVIACADIKMRQVGLERIRRRVAKDHEELTTAGLKSEYDPAKPWDLCFREAAQDSTFWTKEVDKKVIQYMTAQRSRGALSDPGCGDLRFTDGGGKRSADQEASGSSSKRSRPTRKNRGVEQGAPPPPRPWQPAQQHGSKGKGKGKKGGKNGKRTSTDAGLQICWNWNQHHGGCSEPCPGGRAHVCEICCGPHRTLEHK